ncbi:hypothetical protein EUGRSUZ_A00043 [Eucalyptus grandis]|uniref:Uncharacterized protein n=2 Tax=Eucalyptus grandis TaxID=71139 RepID=A0ACC3LZ14_EUCGR|nr:hypothetical protein EUGRSUZ_A00043 [Eucalyptus grandis]
MRASMWWQLLLSMLTLVSSCAARRIQGEATIELPPPLQWQFYQNSCPDAEKYVRDQVEFYWKQDRTLAPKLIRIVYSDCFVKGCDASVLLDGPDSEKTAPQNAAFLGFTLEVIDKIKEVLEQHCPGVVSCADIINLAARDAVVLTGCQFIADRLYNFNKTGKPDPSVDPSFLSQLREQCPPNSTNQVYLNPDSGSSYNLGKTFYSRVLNHRAVLGIDQQIAANNDSYQIAQRYDASFKDFKKMFGRSMTRLGLVKLLPGDQGEVRKNCRVVNAK